jgi:DNA-binding transcriptional MocR family regulator
MRDYYFATDLDLGSSGVASYSIDDLKNLCGLELDGLDVLVLRDGKPLGADTVRQVLADRFTDGEPARVMTTSGSSEAMFLTMSSLLSAGDEVVVVEPVYQQLVAIARSLSCRIVPWPLREATFEPDLDDCGELSTQPDRSDSLRGRVRGLARHRRPGRGIPGVGRGFRGHHVRR